MRKCVYEKKYRDGLTKRNDGGKKMIIKLPHIDAIDTLNIPKDFEEKIKHSFKMFTELTNPRYTYEDKLKYLDNLRSWLHPCEADEAVKQLILDNVEFELDEYQDFPDKDVFWSMGFMCECFEKGNKPLRDTYEKHSSSKNDQTLTVIFKIIQIVINWEE